MGKALGWVVLLFFVLVLGTHPAVMAGFMHDLLGVLRGAANELAAFIGSL